VTNTKCLIGKVISPDDEHPQRVEKRNNHTKNNCAPSWLYLQYYTGMRGQHNVKNLNEISSIKITEDHPHRKFRKDNS